MSSLGYAGPWGSLKRAAVALEARRFARGLLASAARSLHWGMPLDYVAEEVTQAAEVWVTAREVGGGGPLS